MKFIASAIIEYQASFAFYTYHMNARMSIFITVNAMKVIGKDQIQFISVIMG
ncbi:hypothetical protein HMPREF9135_1338 [Segatella baroniae F0067]|uniref:Uncharacterized protein n=1 Tax=Segatella baroniae F0067 TaxID=1115809 RepID=U2QGV5_9BACT|nr:hypothetical protein HMPREF9135_1338 [Segatella baroniae F0067]